MSETEDFLDRGGMITLTAEQNRVRLRINPAALQCRQSGRQLQAAPRRRDRSLIMAVFLRDTPIKRKLMLVILLTSSFALFLMGSAVITYELVTFRRSLAVNMGVLAQIVGSNSTAALAFQDPKSAQEILGALSAEHQITAAAIYDQNGNVFARFPDTAPRTSFPARPGPAGYTFEQSHLHMFQPIVQEGTRLGTIYIKADLGEMYPPFSRLRRAASARHGVLLPRRDRA